MPQALYVAIQIEFNFHIGTYRNNLRGLRSKYIGASLPLNVNH